MKKRNIEATTGALVVHHLPGRLRLRLPDKKLDADYVARLRSALDAVPGVSRPVINPRTGSVFIPYEPEAAPGLQQFLEANELFFLRPDSKVAEAAGPGNRLRGDDKAANMANAAGQFPASQLVVLGLVGWSCYKLLRGNWTAPEWYVTLWYAHSLYRESQRERSGQVPP